jgi:release factor glutamine methyltransferase
MDPEVHEPVRRPAGPSRGEVLLGVLSELEAAGLETPRVEAERLIAHALGIPRSDLVLHAGARLQPEEAAAVARAVGRRLEREPLQHIEGAAAFRQLILVSDRRALIPRPETEQLVDRIADWLGERAPVARVLDIGTGSGAIALALLTEGLAERVVGLDVSAAALAQARENLARSDVDPDRLELRQCPAEIWPAVGPGAHFDLIVSNPPYVREGDLTALPEEINEFEPREALAAGADGLDVIRVIIAGSPAHLCSGGALCFEIGSDQGPAVRDLLAREESLEDISIEPDLAGRDRFAMARSKDSETRGS